MKKTIFTLILIFIICVFQGSIVSAAMPPVWEEVFSNDEIVLYMDTRSVEGRSDQLIDNKSPNGIYIKYYTYVIGKYINKKQNSDYIFELFIDDNQVTAKEGTFCKNGRCETRPILVDWKVPHGSVSRFFVEEAIAYKINYNR